jgi:peptidoglycan/LPS O-acetylase OafA/YrhL
MVYSLLILLSLLALPLFIYLVKHQGKPYVDKFHRSFSKSLVFVAFFIVLTFTQALPAPGGQNPFFYFVIFLLGFICCSDERYQLMFNRIRGRLLLMLLASVPLWLALSYIHRDAPDMGAVDISLACLRSFNILITLMVLLGYGNKFLNVPNRWLPYMNEAAFPIYIIHQTVLVVTAYYVIDWPMGIWLKFLITMVFSLLISWLIYEVVIKRTSFTRRLFGVKISAKRVNQLEEVTMKSKF